MRQPASADLVEQLLSELIAKTVAGADGADAQELKIMVFSAELRRFPADVVAAVLRGWTGKFFPSWNEIAPDLARLSAPRRLIAEALASPPALAPGMTDRERDDMSARVKVLRQHIATLERIQSTRGRLTPSDERALRTKRADLAATEKALGHDQP